MGALVRIIYACRCGRPASRALVSVDSPSAHSSSLSQPLSRKSYRYLSSSVIPQEADHPATTSRDLPVKYSTSRAFMRRFLDFRSDEHAPKYQGKVIAVSLAVFMIYFFAWREENDLDQAMETPLWDRVPGLEKQTLLALINHLRKKGKDTGPAMKRLAEIEAEESAAVSFGGKTPRFIAIVPPPPKI